MWWLKPPLPALVTVSNEVGGAALSDHAQHHGRESQASNAVEGHGSGAGPGPPGATARHGRTVFPARTQQCEIIAGADAAEAGTAIWL